MTAKGPQITKGITPSAAQIKRAERFQRSLYRRDLPENTVPPNHIATTLANMPRSK